MVGAKAFIGRSSMKTSALMVFSPGVPPANHRPRSRSGFVVGSLLTSSVLLPTRRSVDRLPQLLATAITASFVACAHGRGTPRTVEPPPPPGAPEISLSEVKHGQWQVELRTPEPTAALRFARNPDASRWVRFHGSALSAVACRVSCLRLEVRQRLLPRPHGRRVHDGLCGRAARTGRCDLQFRPRLCVRVL